MSTYDNDDDIEFDFFDEPETVEATQRGRRLQRRDRGGDGGGEGPRRPPMRAPTGLVPLARLVGLIAIAIAVVVALVFWVGACQGKNKHADYAAYAAKVNTIAKSSSRLGVKFANRLTASGLKQADLEQSLQQYAQQEQQAYDQAQQIRAPGPLRRIHQHLVDALELRAKGLASLGDALSQTANAKDASTAAAALTAKAQLLSASDVVWDELYKLPASQQLVTLGITGVVIPESHFVTNTDLVGARSLGLLFGRLHPASTGGTPTGKHGDGLVSVAWSSNASNAATLSTSTATKVTVSADLSIVATVENSGDFQEVTVPVTLTIMVGGKPMIDSNGKPLVRRQTITSIQAAERHTVTFTNFSLPTSAFASQPSIKVEVGPVPGEIFLANNSATYPVFFSLSGP